MVQRGIAGIVFEEEQRGRKHGIVQIAQTTVFGCGVEGGVAGGIARRQGLGG